MPKVTQQSVKLALGPGLLASRLAFFPLPQGFWDFKVPINPWELAKMQLLMQWGRGRAQDSAF